MNMKERVYFHFEAPYKNGTLMTCTSILKESYDDNRLDLIQKAVDKGLKEMTITNPDLKVLGLKIKVSHTDSRVKVKKYPPRNCNLCGEECYDYGGIYTCPCTDMAW